MQQRVARFGSLLDELFPASIVVLGDAAQGAANIPTPYSLNLSRHVVVVLLFQHKLALALGEFEQSAGFVSSPYPLNRHSLVVQVLVVFSRHVRTPMLLNYNGSMCLSF